MWSVKNWNGARSPYSSPMKSSGVLPAKSTIAKATRCASAGRRSPSARLPTWSWFCAQTTSRSGSGRVELAHDALQRAERRVVPLVLAGEQDVQLVVEVVEPHRVVSPLLERAEVVGAHLADHETGARARFSSRRTCTGESSKIACTASSRRPSIA